ncbi:hypothetical protein O6H91_Y310400 [Diphasiastrum complanatum]|nr:hypothetical protein O6H91_Y310400 [Diphasiastrum complanatum]
MGDSIIVQDQCCEVHVQAFDDKLDLDVSGTTNEGQSEGHELIQCATNALSALASANMEILRISLKSLNKDTSKDDFHHAVEELEKLLKNSHILYSGMVKQALTLFFEWTRSGCKGNGQDFDEEFQSLLKALRMNIESAKLVEKDSHDSQQDDLKLESLSNISRLGSLAQPLLHSKSETTISTTFEVNNKSEPQDIWHSNVQKDVVRIQEKKWSDSWKIAMQGVLKKQRRERIRDKAIRRMKATPRRIIPKSETTKEHLRKILGNNFLFGDLDVALREEMIDAFQDVRVSPSTEVIKQGDVADNFYIIDVGEFDILAKRGNEPPILLTSKGAGECFGELALMYDNLRNATVKAKTHALLWAVDRATFKSIMSRHLSGSPRAQILREAPSFKRLSSREIVHLSNHCNVESFSRGQHILKAGSCMDKVLESAS